MNNNFENTFYKFESVKNCIYINHIIDSNRANVLAKLSV